MQSTARRYFYAPLLQQKRDLLSPAVAHRLSFTTSPFKSLHKIKRQNTHSDILSFWRRKRDLNPRDRFQPYSLSRGAPSPLGYFSKKVNIKKIGGEGGIRTHVPVKANGFQDRLVMTTSIPLHNY